MIMNEVSPTLVTADFTLSALRLSWCSDCHEDSLFERPPADVDDLDSGEWACTACGAAYLDGIDLFEEVKTITRVVA